MDLFTEQQLKKLCRPFKDSEVQLKPVYTGDYEIDAHTGERSIPEGAWGMCSVCGKRHALPARHLRYVGHALITRRLNEVDPEWTWEPMATDDRGLPVVRGGNLWIYLTVCGVTRIGVGDAGGKVTPSAEKEMVGDAIRNAAMRFGCGLDMWIDGELGEEVGAEPKDDDEEVIEL